jgi:hypothetical protein
MEKTITLSVEDWKNIMCWLETHRDRENYYTDCNGNPDIEQLDGWKEWQDEYNSTEKAIYNLRKKLTN